MQQIGGIRCAIPPYELLGVLTFGFFKLSGL
jgi:hypothetical protein